MDSNSNIRSNYKKIYFSKLLFTDPKIYETYKKMKYTTKVAYSNQNTTHTSLETINSPPKIEFIYKKNNNKINRNQNQKTKISKNNEIKKDKPYLSYLEFLKTKGYTFNKEKRFIWQNLEEKSYPTGMNTFPKTSKFIKINNYFENGFEGFYNKKFDIVEKRRRKKHIFLSSNDISFNRTKRVLFTEIDDKSTSYIERRHKKSSTIDKFYNNIKGGMASLINKTPLNINNRGIKIVKRNNSSELNLFRNDYGQFELKKVRKHFPPRLNDIFGLRKNHSIDNLRRKRGDYRKAINPINWRINIS